MRVSMAAIIQQAERKFNLDQADGVSRRHRFLEAAVPAEEGLRIAERMGELHPKAFANSEAGA